MMLVKTWDKLSNLCLPIVCPQRLTLLFIHLLFQFDQASVSSLPAMASFFLAGTFGKVIQITVDYLWQLCLVDGIK